MCHGFIKNTNDSDIKEPEIFFFVHKLTLLHLCQLQDSFFPKTFLWSPVSCFPLKYLVQATTDSDYWILRLLDLTQVFFLLFFLTAVLLHLFFLLGCYLRVLSVVTGAVLHVILPGFHTAAAGSVPPRINVCFVFLLNKWTIDFFN